MYKSFSAYLFPFTVICLVAALGWGYQLREEKQTILMKAENHYQRAFQELSANVGSLHQELGQLHTMNDGTFAKKRLANIWRLSGSAQSDLSQLPMVLTPFRQTEELLNRISDFSYRASVRDLQRSPLQDSERKLMKNLYRRTGEIAASLDGMRTKIFDNQIRWMDVEIALAQSENKQKNEIVDGYSSLSRQIDGYHELVWQPQPDATLHSASQSTADTIHGLRKFSTAQLLERAQTFTGSKIKLHALNEKSKLQSKVVSFRQTGSGQTDSNSIFMQFDATNGQPLVYMNPRKVGEPTIDENQAEQAASAFIKKHKFPSMTLVSTDSYEKTMSFTFVEKRGRILIYPNQVILNVALDRGTIIGMQAKRDSQNLNVLAEKISKGKRLPVQSVRRMLSANFSVKSEALALIKNDELKFVLCYRFDGLMDEHHYRMFLNVIDGTAEKIELLDEAKLP